MQPLDVISEVLKEAENSTAKNFKLIVESITKKTKQDKKEVEKTLESIASLIAFELITSGSQLTSDILASYGAMKRLEEMAVSLKAKKTKNN